MRKVDKLQQRAATLEAEYVDVSPYGGLIKRMDKDLLSGLATLVSLKRNRANKRKAFSELNEQQKRQLWKLYRRRDRDANQIKRELGPDWPEIRALVRGYEKSNP